MRARKTDAKRWAQDTQSAIRKNRYFKSAPGNRCTLAEAIDRYAREVLPRKPKAPDDARVQEPVSHFALRAFIS
jgi:hypothetical protein